MPRFGRSELSLLCLFAASGCGSEAIEREDDGAAGSGSGVTSSGSGGGPASSAGGGGGMPSGGASGAASGGSGGAVACTAEQCLFEWPLDGSAAHDWIIANYVDRTPGTGILDYHGGTRSYEGHQGVDIAIASFRLMDQGVVARAVAPGLVTAIHDGEPDRNTVADPGNCSLVANSVVVQHPDGLEARYLHFRNASIAVTVGQEIMAGDELGLVGSSGCSESPHLHFELRDPQNGDAVLDPFFEGRWATPPAYDVAPGVMEVVFKSGGFSTTSDVQNAPTNPTSLPSGMVGLSVITGGTLLGETLQVLLYQGDVLENTLSPYQYDGSEDHYMRWWNPSLSAGNWRADVSLGNQVVDTVSFQVN